jgi:beta-glucosidase
MPVRISDPAVQQFEKDHENTVRTLAAQCAVLLKNDDHTLPLDHPSSIALFGAGARQTVKGGTGSGDVNVRHVTTIEEGLEEAGIHVTTRAWLDQFDIAREQGMRDYFTRLRAKVGGLNNVLAQAWCITVPQQEYTIDLPTPSETGSDTAVYVIARNSGEGLDRKDIPGDIRLTDSETRDILRLNKLYPHFVLILNVGGMVDLTPVLSVKTILLLSQLGSATGNTCADILLGTSAPSGHLTMTWAPLSDYASTNHFDNEDDNDYREGIFVGYRGFDAAGLTPLFPFGYGLTYTSFSLKPGTVRLDGTDVCVPVTVTNTGRRNGRESVQVYVSQPVGTRHIAKAYQKLAGYAKTDDLAPTGTQDVTVRFPLASLTSYDSAASAWVLEAGDYIVRVGTSSRSTHVAARLHVGSDIIVEQDHAIGGDCGFTDTVPSGTPITYAGEQDEIAHSPVVEVPSDVITTRTVIYPGQPAEIPAGPVINFEDVLAGKKTVRDFVAGLTNEQLVDLAVGRYNNGVKEADVIGSASSRVAGAAGETTQRLAQLGVPTLTEADGPAGVRLNRAYYMDDHGGAHGLTTSLAFDAEPIFTHDEWEKTWKARFSNKKAPEGVQTYWQNCVAIPIGTALAQAFNPDVPSQCADLVGDEMQRFGINVWLAPAMNIQRNPLDGRDFEYYSEDPLVAGLTAAAITQGVQSHPGCSVCIKHFVANNQENNRVHENNNISEQALREIYLKGFEICVRLAHPKTVMTSYNLVNQIHSCNRHDLLTEALRDEWGFTGFVMTDWLVTVDTEHVHHKWPIASAAGCVKAGNNVTMPGFDSDKSTILNAIDNPKDQYPLTRAELQKSACEVLNVVADLTKGSRQ